MATCIEAIRRTLENDKIMEMIKLEEDIAAFNDLEAADLMSWSEELLLELELEEQRCEPTVPQANKDEMAANKDEMTGATRGKKGKRIGERDKEAKTLKAAKKRRRQKK